jgi:hypothetical protein
VVETTTAVERYRATNADERADAVRQLGGLLAATHAELLSVVAATIHERDWSADGATDPAAWLVAMCGLNRHHAAEWARVALALEDLPALRAAYADGTLSWDQIRPASRFADASTDAAVRDEIDGLSARQVEIMARQRRPITRPEAQDEERHQSLVFRADRRRGGIRLSGRFPTDVGAAIATALARHAEQMGPDAATGRWDPLPRRLARALHDLASADNSTEPDPDVGCVVLHADAAIVDGRVAGNGTIGECAVHVDGVLRALCDARVEAHLHGPDGATVGVARARRTIPTWLRRVVSHRDGTCRFPGCERPIRQLHHIHHWAHGGPTDADNLVGLCWAHHVLVHDGGWRIRGRPGGQLTFQFGIRRAVSSRPDPVRPSTLRSSPLARLVGPTPQPDAPP